MAKIYIQNPRWDKTTVLRQTDFFSGFFDNHIFSPLQVANDYEWAIIDGNIDNITKQIDRSKRIYFVMENPHIWMPDREFWEQVGIVVSPFNLNFPSHIQWVKSHPCIPWFYGIPFKTNTGTIHANRKTKVCLYDLRNRQSPEKQKLFSIIASNKGYTPGHRWRMSILNELKNYFGNNIDIFGFGHAPVEKKEDAIDKYKFCIALENMGSEHYWSEKLSDVILGWSTPIYSGATCVNNYFDNEVPTIEFGIDPLNFIEQCKKILEKSSDDHNALEERRDKILYQHNIFGKVSDIIAQVG